MTSLASGPDAAIVARRITLASYCVVMKFVSPGFSLHMTCTLPRGPAGRFNRMAGAGLGVGTQTKYADESWEFVKHITGPEAPDYAPDEIAEIALRLRQDAGLA